MIKASSWSTVISYLPPCLAWVIVDLPEPERPNTEAIELTAEERAAFREATQPVYDNYFKEHGKDLYDKVMTFQETYEAEAPRN